tara:strand:+ start:661 stop:1269 length:609 start_codon:yes stop_codon:yes gene_type:complete
MAGKRTYRTSQGKTVDLGALLLQNENTRAVGNMGVNARGDRIDNSGKVVDSKVQQTKRQYNKQIGLVDELPATSRRAAAALVEDPVVQQEQPAPAKPRKSSAEKAATKAAKTSTKKTPAAKKTATKKVEPKIREVSPTVLDIEVEETVVPQQPVIETPVVEETAPVAPRGLADAIARARSIKQEQAKTPRQLAQEKAGVRKI